MVPTLKKLPELCELDTRFAVPELSVAVGWIKVTVVPAVPRDTVWVMSSGQVSCGASLSTVVEK